MTYYADGTAFEAREITWDMNGVTADTFKNIGDIVTINGKVSALVRPTRSLQAYVLQNRRLTNTITWQLLPCI
mgnify:CR=1 FL=1